MTMTIKEACERIYAGRHQLRELGCDPTYRNVEIVIGPEAWADLLIEYRKLLDEEMIFRISTPLEHQGPNEFKIFGITARCASDLEPNEIRFRSEVTL